MGAMLMAQSQKSEFGSKYMRGELNVPGPKPLPRVRFLGNMPHVIAADEQEYKQNAQIKENLQLLA